MDLARIDATLSDLRDRGDCSLRPSVHVSAGFLSIPPHRVGIAHLMLKPRFLLADPVGCGKTPQALVAFAMLREKAPTLRLLVVTTKSALYQWQSAVTKFLRKLNSEIVGSGPEGVRSGPNDSNPTPNAKVRVGTRNARIGSYTRSRAPILITTYASMARDVETIVETLDHFIVVFDEVQAVKSNQQRLLRPAALKVSCKARYAWGLSATPISNRLEELHAIMEVLRPGLFGSERRFQDTYLRRRWIQPPAPTRGWWKVDGHQHLPQLMSIMRPYFLRRPSSVIDLHLPAVVTQTLLIEPLPEQARIYNEIVREYFLPANPTRDGKPVTKLASLTYAQQAADAPYVLGYEGARSAKEFELLRFLEEEVTDEKVIIYARYERVVSYLCRLLATAGITSVRITGKESAIQREAAKVCFNTTSSTNVVVLNAAGGQAIDLQAASLVVFYDLPWSWGEFQQVLGRARRLGSKHLKVLAVLLAINNTIDTVTLTALSRKETLVAHTIGLDTDPEDTDPEVDPDEDSEVEQVERVEQEVEVNSEVEQVQQRLSESFVRSAFQAVRSSCISKSL